MAAAFRSRSGNPAVSPVRRASRCKPGSGPSSKPQARPRTMNVVFLSPHFPPNWWRFVVGLREVGATHPRHRRRELGAAAAGAARQPRRLLPRRRPGQLRPADARARLLHPPPRADRPARLAQRALARDRGAAAHRLQHPRHRPSAHRRHQAQVADEERFLAAGLQRGPRPVCRTRASARAVHRARSAIRSWRSPTSASARPRPTSSKSDDELERYLAEKPRGRLHRRGVRARRDHHLRRPGRSVAARSCSTRRSSTAPA